MLRGLGGFAAAGALSLSSSASLKGSAMAVLILAFAHFFWRSLIWCDVTWVGLQALWVVCGSSECECLGYVGRYCACGWVEMFKVR